MTLPLMKSARVVAVAIAAASLAASATAQDNAAEMNALKQRVSELEARLPKDSGSGAGDMKWNEFQTLGSKWKLNGWLRLDAQYDDSRMNNDQVPEFVLSEDTNPSVPAAAKAPNNSSELAIHPKLTRLWIDVAGPKISELGDATASGRLEVDFYNSTSAGAESRQALRIRVAWLQLKWTELSFSAGQMWDVISPLMPIVNNDQVMWNVGNLADRRPQARLEWAHAMGDTSKLTVTGMVGETGVIDNQDLDPATSTGRTFRDGDSSGQPTYQARAGWKQTIDKEWKDFEAGVWAHHASEETDVTVGNTRNFVSSVYGLDAQFPLLKKKLWARGELWHGRNLDDVRGGIKQGVNTTTGHEIRSEGGWGEFGYQLLDKVAVYGGYSFDNPNNDDLAAGARSRNRAAYGAVRFDFKPVLLGVEYLHWVTGYTSFNDGDAQRVVGFIQFSF